MKRYKYIKSVQAVRCCQQTKKKFNNRTVPLNSIKSMITIVFCEGHVRMRAALFESAYVQIVLENEGGHEEGVNRKIRGFNTCGAKKKKPKKYRKRSVNAAVCGDTETIRRRNNNRKSIRHRNW